MPHYYAIFISDIHLGTKGCNAENLNKFLKEHTCEKLYIVGDAIDGWRLKRTFYWPETHNKIIQRILYKSKKKTDIIYITGNHDEFLRNFTPTRFGNIQIVDEYYHESKNGKNYLIIHGDDFDGVVKYHKWFALVGDWGYTVLVYTNRWFNYFQSKFGMKKWSLSKHIKYHVKQAMEFIYNFEKAVAQNCRDRDFDSVFVGHIHHPEIKKIENIEYLNCGDWVENCSAIVEDYQGNFHLIKDYHDQ